MNITYLFGAGASKNALPIVNEIPSRLLEFKEFIERQTFSTDPEQITLHAAQGWLVEDLQWLITATKAHASIDTFAKKLFIRKEYKNLKRLKVALSLFFNYLQDTKPVDIRYDSFFASIIKDDAEKLPEGIKIISWNYDSQFERAFNEFFQIDINRFDNPLNIYSKKIKDKPEKNGFSICKLNGTAAFLSVDSGQMYCLEKLTDAKRILSEYAFVNDRRQRIECCLSFAWEIESVDVCSSAIEAVKDTEVLVIVGYSFPFFNREIDQRIIRKMTSLSKIYFQDVSPHVPMTRIDAILPTSLQTVSKVSWPEVSQFLLPNELSL